MSKNIFSILMVLSTTHILMGNQNCICLAFKPVYDNFSVVSLYIFDEIYILLESPFMLSELNKGFCPYNAVEMHTMLMCCFS